ncbi:MAG: minor capsid protein [Bacillota bacterium]|nr:minor capsid protein [Bacillota bacterium]
MALDDRHTQYAVERERLHIVRARRDETVIRQEMGRIAQYTLDACRRDAEAWVARYATTEGITIAEARKRASAADIEALARKAEYYVANRRNVLIAFSPQANAEMRLYNLQMKLNRQQLLEREMGLELIKMADDMAYTLGEHLKDTAVTEFRRQAGLLAQSVPDARQLAFDARTIAEASFHGTTFSEDIWANQEVLRQRLNEGLTRSLQRGESPLSWMQTLDGYMTEAFKGKKDRGGIEYAMERLAVTETARVQVAAQKKAYEEAGYETFQFVAEPSACPICAAKNGDRTAVEDMRIGINAPPIHPNCRCSTVAYADRDEVEAAISEYEKYVKEASGAMAPPPPDRRNFKTKTAVREFLQQELGFQKVTATNVDLSILTDIANTLDEFYTEFPQLHGFINEFVPVTSSKEAAASASIRFDGRAGVHTRLVVNLRSFADPEQLKRMIDANVKAGFWTPKDGARDIIRHELTHMLEYCQAFQEAGVDPRGGDRLAQALVLRELRGRKFSSDVVRTAFTNLGVSYDQVTVESEIGTYASVNSAETIAESVGSSLRNRVMEEIVKVLKEKLK